ncbi:MAG: hypothetical protein U5N58_03515 [Actinomycetota bacterium]|nr:hypothetical protein [Actinomycetota bacterium]
MVKKIRAIVEKELEYMATLYPFDPKPYYDTRLLYASGLLFLCRDNLAGKKGSREWKILNLAAGIELLGLGCGFHNFDMPEGSKKILGQDQDRYTLNLLFGDVLYSRAINYLVKFEDMLIFDEVINSLKSIHKARLSLYGDLLKLKEKKISIENILEDRVGALLSINSLFKNSFLIGYSIFPPPWPRDLAGDISYIYRFVNHITLLKSCRELEELLKATGFMEMDALEDKKNFIKDQLDDIIAQLKIDWLQRRLTGQVNQLWDRI